MMTDNRAPAPPVLKALFSDMTTDAVNKSSEDVEMKPYDYELIQKNQGCTIASLLLV